jgi:hypothetical protein
LGQAKLDRILNIAPASSAGVFFFNNHERFFSMIQAGEVGVIFDVKNEASATLQRIADEFNRIQLIVDKVAQAVDRIGGADGGLLKLQEALGLTAKAGEDSASTITESFGRVDAAVKTAAEGVNALKASFIEAAEAAKAIQVASSNLGGGGSGGPHSPFGGGPGSGMGIPGGAIHPIARALGMASFLTGNPAIDIPIETAGYGVEQAAQVEDRITKILMNANQPQTEANKQALRDQFNDASSMGISPLHAADAYLSGGRLLSSLPYDEQLRTQRALLPAARVEQQMKGVSLEEGQEKFIELAHQAGVYDTAGLEKLSNAFAFASTHTSASLPTLERALSYSLPELHSTLGMDPQTAMALTVMTQNAGVTNTKSGTWIRSLFEHSVNEESGSKQAKAHNAALQKLGLSDADGHSTWTVRGADGQTDWAQSVAKFSATLNKFNAEHQDPADRISTMHTAFGAQGGSEAALLALDNFVKQLPEFMKNQQGYAGTVDAQKTLQDNSPTAQFQKTLADAEQVLTRLGTIALPAFVGGLKAIDAVLEGMNKALGWATKQAVGPDGKPMMLDEQPGYAGLWGPSQAHAAEVTGLRDPRSPSSAAGNVMPYSSSTIHAPSAAAPNVAVSVQPTLSVTTLPVSVTVDNGGMLSQRLAKRQDKHREQIADNMRPRVSVDMGGAK